MHRKEEGGRQRDGRWNRGREGATVGWQRFWGNLAPPPPFIVFHAEHMQSSNGSTT